MLLVVLAVISWRAGRFSPLLLAAFYTVGIFTFAHCMHERYPVSYTHLDVYKRQVLSWALCKRAAHGSTMAISAWARAAITPSFT